MIEEASPFTSSVSPPPDAAPARPAAARPTVRRARRASVRQSLARFGFAAAGLGLVALVLLLPASVFDGTVGRVAVEPFPLRTFAALVLALASVAAGVRAWRVVRANAHRLDPAARFAGRIPLLLAAPLAVVALALMWMQLR